MSLFRQIQEAEDPQLQALYKEAVEFGFASADGAGPNNFVTSLSERPDLLAGVWGLIKSVALGGQLPPTVKQMIGMAIAMQNDCRYCRVAYAHALEAMGVPTAVVRSCASDPQLREVPPPQRAIVQFAVRAARDPKSVGEEDVQALRDQGLSDGEIMEVVMMAAAANLLDMWADVSRIAVDGEE